MGQYHYIVNLTKHEFLHPHQLASGLKLVEQANTEASSLQALFAALACSNGRGGGDFQDHKWVGRWKGDRVVVLGDYCVQKDLDDIDAQAVWRACHGEEDCDQDHADLPCFKDVSAQAGDFLEKQWRFKFTLDTWPQRQWADGREDRPGLMPDMIIRPKM